MRTLITRLIIALAIIIPYKAHATPTAQDISNSCGLSTQCGYLIANLNFTLQNNTYITSVDAAGTGTLNLIKGNGSDDTVINSSASDDLILQLEDDANRLITFDAGSDTALSMRFGDGGTATQVYVQSASTSDADDDSTQRICGGGGYASDGSRGACISLPGEEVVGGGDIAYVAGASDTHVFSAGSTQTMSIGATGVVTAAGGLVATTGGVTATAGNITATAGDVILTLGDLTITSGTLNIPAAANLGLVAENGANTACDTTCTVGCVAGYDAGTSAFVACDSALADSCLCAGSAS